VKDSFFKFFLMQMKVDSIAKRGKPLPHWIAPGRVKDSFEGGIF
jgi:hypothetical protein